MADYLPDELWRRTLEIGVQNRILTHEDLCRFAISSRRLRRLSSDDSLWSSLLSSDFPQHNTTPNPTATSTTGLSKLVYRTRYEKDRERKRAAHRRAVLRLESVIAQSRVKTRQLWEKMEEEKERLRTAVEELSSLEKIRQASVALNVWQPEVVRGRQQQIVEQCAVPVDSRINMLKMEIKLCRMQIVTLDRSYRDEQHRLQTTKEQLTSLEYHPSRDYSSIGSMISSSHANIIRKKFKRKHYDIGNEGCSSALHWDG